MENQLALELLKVAKSLVAVSFNPQGIVHLLKSHGIPIAKLKRQGRELIQETGVSVSTMNLSSGKKGIFFQYHTWGIGATHPDSEKTRLEGEKKVIQVLEGAGLTAKENIPGSGAYRIFVKNQPD